MNLNGTLVGILGLVPDHSSVADELLLEILPRLGPIFSLSMENVVLG